MTLGEIIEKRGHKYDDQIGRTSVADWYAGYMLGWKWAYQDMKEILEYNGFDMNQLVIPTQINPENVYGHIDISKGELKMEKTLCQKCFHYEACKAIDLSGTVGNPEYENESCDYFMDVDRVKIQDRANWVEEITHYRSSTDVHVTHRCGHCGNLRRVRCYVQKEWADYYSEHYRNGIELPEYCEKCGSVMNDIVENSSN